MFADIYGWFTEDFDTATSRMLKRCSTNKANSRLGQNVRLSAKYSFGEIRGRQFSSPSRPRFVVGGSVITIYRSYPGWYVPCISPFVTQTVYYLRMAAIPHEIKRQYLSRLKQDAAYGKLPYIEDNGKK